MFVEPNGKDYLLLACHHLAVDVISWNIIIDELLEHYEHIIENKFPDLTPENTVNRFYNELYQYPPSISKGADRPLQKMHRLTALSTEHGNIDKIHVHQIAIPFEISALLQNPDKLKLSSTLSGYLLSAFSKSVLQECNQPEITIDVEFHGRPQEKNLPDLSRSVAWWAVSMPVNLRNELLNPVYCSELFEKEAVFANRINLNYSEFPFWNQMKPDVRFNYLGHFPAQFGNSAFQLHPSGFNPGSTRSMEAQKEYKLNFTCRSIGESLIIDIQHHSKWLSKTNIENIIRTFLDQLKYDLDIDDLHLHSPHFFAPESNIPSVGQPLYNFRIGKSKKEQGKKVIFLTGATGFLGCHLLNEINRNNNVTVYCLVRGVTQAHAENNLYNALHYYFRNNALIDKARIKVVKGDLLYQHLGMSETDYDEIMNKADLILHMAADTNLMKDYSELLRINVFGTKQLVELAQAGRQKAIHYMSTLALSGYSPSGECRDFCENDFDQNQFFVSDYERTKFEAEKIVRQFFANNGEGKIYRVGHIAADSIYGKFQRNIEHNRIFQIIKGIILLKKIPDTYLEKVSFSYVDIVANMIANICMENIESTTKCLHVENSQYISFFKIVEMLRQIGYEIEVTDMDNFKNYVDAFTGSPGDMKIVHLTDGWIQRSLDFPRLINYVQKNSLDLFAKSGLYFPKANVEWLSRMVQEGIKAGFFQSPSQSVYTGPGLVNAEVH